MTDLITRSATVNDLPPIRAIYNHYVLTSTCTFQLEPDTEANRLDWWRLRSDRHPVIVAESNGEVVGWGSLSPWMKREAYARTVEASIYVRADHHRRGIGRQLLVDLIERARQIGHHVVIGGACTEQIGSIALQQSLGFVHIGTFRQTGFKFNRWLDVAYFQVTIE
ncbi:MAG TPA: GNAT family N-acetyltransferase [Gemmataceae bacterium]|jgi:phosphinothricin acetyltransferase|nr:GNAT family N-acetyltransferase [Gemmataceae bacterium]